MALVQLGTLSLACFSKSTHLRQLGEPPPFTYFPILIWNSHQSGNMLDVHMNFISVRNIRDQGKHEAHGKVFEKAVE